MRTDFPVMLHVAGRRCVIVGGGDVAQRRALALLEAGAQVIVIAPTMTEQLLAMEPVTRHLRPYKANDLQDTLLVVVATNDPAVNAAVTQDARRQKVLVNRADQPAEGDLTVPAHAHHGPVTLAVHTSNISAAAAARIRQQMEDTLDPDWPRLLMLIRPFRHIIQEHVDAGETRTQMLRQLVDDAAMARLKQEGDDAVLAFCRALTGDLPPRTGIDAETIS